MPDAKQRDYSSLNLGDGERQTESMGKFWRAFWVLTSVFLVPRDETLLQQPVRMKSKYAH